MTSFWKDTSDGPTKEISPSIPRQEPSARVLSWDHDVVRCPTDFWISFNVKLERKHNRLELVDLWSPSPTKDEECSVYTPGRCPSGSQEFALGAKLGLITPLSNPRNFLVTPILASERCGPSDSVCWPSVMFGELALADEGVHLNPHVMFGVVTYIEVVAVVVRAGVHSLGLSIAWLGRRSIVCS